MLRVLRPDQDAFGHLLTDAAAGRRVIEVVERDDGCVFTGDPSYYLAPFRRWWPQERRAMRFVRGRVLEVGCGAGRVSLHLQERGLGVVGIDVSPLAVQFSSAPRRRRRTGRNDRYGSRGRRAVRHDPSAREQPRRLGRRKAWATTTPEARAPLERKGANPCWLLRSV